MTIPLTGAQPGGACCTVAALICSRGGVVPWLSASWHRLAGCRLGSSERGAGAAGSLRASAAPRLGERPGLGGRGVVS